MRLSSSAFLSSVLKDVKSERPKITEKDHVRLLFVTKWFLEFFLAGRENAKENSQKDSASGTSNIWSFDLVAEVVERSWIVWILKRMREAVEDKVFAPVPCHTAAYSKAVKTMDRAASWHRVPHPAPLAH